MLSYHPLISRKHAYRFYSKSYTEPTTVIFRTNQLSSSSAIGCLIHLSRGCQKISSALEGFEGIAIVSRITNTNAGHEQFVTVESMVDDIPPALILDALGKAGLVNRGVSRQMIVNNDPNLRVTGMFSGSITFEDTNIPR